MISRASLVGNAREYWNMEDSKLTTLYSETSKDDAQRHRPSVAVLLGGHNNRYHQMQRRVGPGARKEKYPRIHVDFRKLDHSTLMGYIDYYNIQA